MALGLKKPKRLKEKTTRERLTVAQYLLKRLDACGVSHLFSARSPYLERLNYYAECDPNMYAIQCLKPQLATHMAAGFCRTKGIGAVALYPNASGFSDAFVRAYAESIPCVFILGASLDDTPHPPLELQELIERGIRSMGAGWTVLDDAKVAARKIDRIIASCMHYQLPVCIELMQEIADDLIIDHTPQKTEFVPPDQNSLQDFLLDVDEMLSHARHPLLYQGAITSAHDVCEEITSFAKRFNITITHDASAIPHDTDLLLVFAEAFSPHSYSGNIIQIRTQDAFCNERRYPKLFFKDTVEALASLECRKLFKRAKIYLKPLSSKHVVLQQILAKHGCQLLSSHAISALLAAHDPLLSYDHQSLPAYAIEAGLGAKLGSPRTPFVALVDEEELESALPALKVALDHDIGLIVCVVQHMPDINHCYGHTRWSLLELTQLFIDSNTCQVQTPRAFEKALAIALQTKNSLILIDCRL